MTTEQAKALVLSMRPKAKAHTHTGMIEIIHAAQVIASALSERGAWNAAAEALKPGSVVPLRIDEINKKDGKETA